MYATQVMPEVAGLFEDEYEDHWWPKGDQQLAPVGSCAQ